MNHGEPPRRGGASPEPPYRAVVEVRRHADHGAVNRSQQIGLRGGLELFEKDGGISWGRNSSFPRRNRRSVPM